MNRVFPVFIASPQDVGLERKHCEEAIQTLAPRLARLFGVTLAPLLWEQFAPISSADATHPQLDILRRIEPYSIFIAVLWRRSGTKIEELGVGGTEAEINHVLANRDRIKILTYFRKQQREKIKRISRYDRKQMDAVLKLEQRLHKQRVWSTSYENAAGFAKRITADLMEAILEMVLAPEPLKLRHYLKFFRFGEPYRPGAQTIFIVYPPITRERSGNDCGVSLDWRQRLLPRVVFEDAKAIQDFEEVMRMMGRKYRTVTLGSPELDLAEPGDRVWVCIPRNDMAHEVLREISTDSATLLGFRFERRTFHKSHRDELCIVWKSRGRKEIVIRSPLAKYLHFSKRPRGQSEWCPKYGYTLARDYAILARFRVKPQTAVDDRETYYHYFVGGIRGLGTWGVGWFIDHRAQQLARVINQSEPDGDLQVLLEVTYRNYRIKDVRSVGHEAPEYFGRRFSDDFIQEELRKAETFA